MTDEASQQHSSSVPAAVHGRRTVLAGVGVVGIATALTACGSSSSTTSAGSGAGAGAGAGATSGAAAPSSAAAGGAAGGGTALGATKDVPVGGGKVFAAEKVVVTQPTAGEFKAFTAICTHMGCTVGSVSGGTINCPCHGSQYHIADGSVARGPAPSALAPETITVANGEITLDS
ncbi:Rieske (2Fe-2S) protein [Streptacidiphilus cavernicola]|uniref:Cytochrome bc1 complex Rieske iron-sulfur subunit n=1 Tax=Streptacidiphilus cavernicola TaxID=3342716 RepID=A0ABV6W0T3_9ACTN